MREHVDGTLWRRAADRVTSRPIAGAPRHTGTPRQMGLLSVCWAPFVFLGEAFDPHAHFSTACQQVLSFLPGPHLKPGRSPCSTPTRRRSIDDHDDGDQRRHQLTSIRFHADLADHSHTASHGDASPLFLRGYLRVGHGTTTTQISNFQRGLLELLELVHARGGPCPRSLPASTSRGLSRCRYIHGGNTGSVRPSLVSP